MFFINRGTRSIGPKDSLKETTLPLLIAVLWCKNICLGRIDFKFDIRRNCSFDSYQTRRCNDLHLPPVRTNWGKQTFSKDWNNLDNDIKNSKSLSFFKQGHPTRI